MISAVADTTPSSPSKTTSLDDARTAALPTVVPPKFILGSAPFSADGLNWLVHTEHPVYFARIVPTEAGIKMDPYFALPTETIEPQLLARATQAGEEFYRQLVKSLEEAGKA